jgi:hypothetical protein
LTVESFKAGIGINTEIAECTEFAEGKKEEFHPSFFEAECGIA